MEKQKKTPEDWKNITKRELFELSFKQNTPDSIIADMYGVSKGAVTYKRRVKFGMALTPDSDAFRQSCKERIIEEVQKRADLLDVEKEHVIWQVETCFSDIKDVF